MGEPPISLDQGGDCEPFFPNLSLIEWLLSDVYDFKGSGVFPIVSISVFVLFFQKKKKKKKKNSRIMFARIAIIRHTISSHHH